MPEPLGTTALLLLLPRSCYRCGLNERRFARRQARAGPGTGGPEQRINWFVNAARRGGFPWRTQPRNAETSALSYLAQARAGEQARRDA